MPVISTMRRRVGDNLVPAFGPMYIKAPHTRVISYDRIDSQQLVDPHYQAYAPEHLPVDSQKLVKLKPRHQAYAPEHLPVDSQKLVKPRHQAYADSPEYLPIEWINACGGLEKPLGKFSNDFRTIIVGAGWAGVNMGLELTKAGNKPILIEARDECGGRMSKQHAPGLNEYHPGSMRYAPSEGMLFEKAYHYGFGMTAGFVDPGIYPTLLAFDIVQYWDDPTKIPEGFETEFYGWAAMLKEGFEIDGKQFAAFNDIATLLRSPSIEDRKTARLLWQTYIDHFKDNTLKEIMIAIFVESAKPPGGKRWTMDNIERWGYGGIGSGGFGVFFPLCALTIMRFLPNEWEVDQCAFAEQMDGKWKATTAQKLVEAIRKDAEERGLETRFGTKLVDVRKRQGEDGHYIYTVTLSSEGTYDLECDELVLALPVTVIVELGLAREDLFPAHICKAMQNVFMVETTKVFATIPRKAFEDPASVRVILGKLFQTYIMDFDDQTHMVALLDYAWAGHSHRYRGEKDPQKCVDIIKEDIRKALKGSKYECWLRKIDNILNPYAIHWKDFELARGAFTFLKPGQDKYCSALFHHGGEDGPYVTTASATPYDGWVEGAEIKMEHDFSHLAKKRGELFHPELAPVNVMIPFSY